MKNRANKRKIRHKRIKAKIRSGATYPRLSVFRSNKHIYLQVIDDAEGKTILSADDLAISVKSDKKKHKKKESARVAGKAIAEKLTEKNIKKVVFDRAGYKYHGRVKEAAEGAREAGLEF